MPKMRRRNLLIKSWICETLLLLFPPIDLQRIRLTLISTTVFICVPLMVKLLVDVNYLCTLKANSHIKMSIFVAFNCGGYTGENKIQKTTNLGPSLLSSSVMLLSF